MTVQVRRRRFTVDEYHQMAEAGVLSESDRLELIKGELLEMSPIGNRHAACVNRLTRLFSTQLGDAAIVSVQNPIGLDPHSEPQPDLALLRPRDDFYAAGHPGPEDVWLLVEVAETSLEYDREVKLPAYAAAGIGEVWLIDLMSGQVLVHRQPSGGVYRQMQRVSRGESLQLALPFPIQIGVGEILG